MTSLVDNSDTLSLAKQLIDIESITPNDNGCQTFICNYLRELGFTITDLSTHGVSNFLAIYGEQGPTFAFSGHTDVVPAGELNLWDTPPFTATCKDGILYGRGAADMKGAVAAMMNACKHYITQHPDQPGRIAIMITSDEEGQATYGTRHIVDHLIKHNISIDYCLIGEASSTEQLGDGIKIGRRGSLHGALTVFGKQGHIAYPHLANNPIHRSFKALDELSLTQWDEGNAHFSPTSFQIYNIHADTGATNIIPGTLSARFNFRFAPCSSAEELQQRVEACFLQHQLDYTIDWDLSSTPFYSPPGKLAAACTQAIQDTCKITTTANTYGGTSDGRFISALPCEIVELGVINKTIHQVNEHVCIQDLEKLSIMYQHCLTQILATNKASATATCELT